MPTSGLFNTDAYIFKFTFLSTICFHEVNIFFSGPLPYHCLSISMQVSASLKPGVRGLNSVTLSTLKAMGPIWARKQAPYAYA